MRHLRQNLLIAVLAAGLVPAALSADRVSGVTIMPLSEVKRGMLGTGIGPFDGKDRQRFSFRVVSIERETGIRPVIIAEVYAGPGRISHPGTVLHGMSGSPVYVGGRLLGAVAETPEFPKDLTLAYILPAELLLMPPPAGVLTDEADLKPSPQSAWQPGDLYCFCKVWGDINRCAEATISVVEGPILVGQAHATGAFGLDAQKPLDTDSIRLPVWKATTFGKMPALDSSTIISQAVGDIVGAVVYNSDNGQVIRADRVPEPLTVTLSFDDPERTGSIKRFSVARSPDATDDVIHEVVNAARERYGTRTPLVADMEVYLANGRELRLTDALVNWGENMKTVKGFSSILQWVLVWTKPSPEIVGISFAVRQTSAELYELIANNAKAESDSFALSATIRRDRDYRQMTRTWMNIPNPAKGETVLLTTGSWLARQILISHSLGEFSAYPPLDGTALYLIALGKEPVPEGSVAGIPKEWEACGQRDSIRIIRRVTDDGIVAFISRDAGVEVPLNVRAP